MSLIADNTYVFRYIALINWLRECQLTFITLNEIENKILPCYMHLDKHVALEIVNKEANSRKNIVFIQ